MNIDNIRPTFNAQERQLSQTDCVAVDILRVGEFSEKNLKYKSYSFVVVAVVV